MSIYGNKIPKSEKDPNIKYAVVWYTDKQKPINKKDYYIIVSMDPAIDNCGFRIEKRWKSGRVDTLEQVNHQYDYSIKNGVSKFYQDIRDFLHSYRKYYKELDFIVIEKQPGINSNSSAVMHHSVSYFMETLKNHPNVPTIYLTNPKNKTKALGAPNNLNKPGIKKWGTAKAIDLCKIRNDHQTLNILTSTKKKDDIADSIIQVEALAKILGWPMTQKIKEDKMRGDLEILSDDETTSIENDLEILSDDEEDSETLILEN